MYSAKISANSALNYFFSIFNAEFGENTLRAERKKRFMSIPLFDEIIEPNDQTAARAEHLAAMRELVGNVYPNKFTRSAVSGTEDTITNILHFAPIVEIVNEIKAIVATLAERERPPAEIKDGLNARLKDLGSVRVSGRLTTPTRGNFVHLTDGINKLQIYAKKATFSLIKNDANNALDEENGWAAFTLLDHGDFIGVEGYLFITNTGELSVHVEKLQFLAKAMLPMPDKMHGVEDAEIKQRRRYLDLIASSLKVEGHESSDEDSALRTPHSALTTRQVFEVRAKTISSLRHFLEDHGYIEVETPMLTPKATGAAAKPFKTHHNALDIDLYARIAPELYLKRLIVGGFEKVYELNRNFRNEGISYKHNPEFTMLEFYCAYMDVNGMMDFCEQLLKESVERATGDLKVRVKQTRGQEPLLIETYLGSRSTPRLNQIVTSEDYINVFEHEIDFSLFAKLSMKQAIASQIGFAHELIEGDFGSWLDSGANARTLDQFLWWAENDLPDEVMVVHGEEPVMQLCDDEVHTLIRKKWNDLVETNAGAHMTDEERGLSLLSLFENVVEERLIQPTFIVDYPKAVSPLSKASPNDPQIAERFELFVNGMEVANGFSELNDPREQYERFVDQMALRTSGDEEAMILDEDYIRALSYGMPPAAGIGIGIDRLVMLLTNKHSIRDVILFPHMRPEKGGNTEEN